MATITGNDGWRTPPQGGHVGTGMRLARPEVAQTGIGPQPRHVGTATSDTTAPAASLWAGVGIGALGGTSLAAGALGARVGMSGIGRAVGIALGVGAVAGAAFLLHQGVQGRSEEFLVHFATEPDLSAVAPADVYATLRDHHARYAPAIERELLAMVDEGKVRSFSGIIGSNGFVVEVERRHQDEMQRRLDAIDEVGEILPSSL